MNDRVKLVTEAIINHECVCNDISAEVHRDSSGYLRCDDCDGLLTYLDRIKGVWRPWPPQKKA